MFSKRSKAVPCVSVIGGDVVVSGDISAVDELRLDGRVEGNVRCGALNQGVNGAIRGDIVADQARLAGLVDGAVTARALVLEPSARVTGNVSYETLDIAGGARIDGRLSHRQAHVAAPASTISGGRIAALFPQAAK